MIRRSEVRLSARPTEKAKVSGYPVGGAAKEAALRESRAFILLSRWEGLSVALLEAMALGVPCVVSPEVAATLGPDAPALVLPHDTTDAARLLGALLADPRAALATGSAGRAWAQEYASPVAVATASLAIYESALSTQASPGRSSSTVAA